MMTEERYSPMSVQKNARLHHKAVSEHQKHIVRKITPRGAKQAVSSIKVDIRVWKTALRLADGDRTRLVVRSETEVSVLNPQFSKKKG